MVWQVAAGRAHSLALCAGGAVFSFGKAAGGQCGHGLSGEETPPIRRPCRVAALAGLAVVDVLASADASAALVAGPAEGATELYQWGASPSLPAPVVALPVRTEGPAAAALFACSGA